MSQTKISAEFDVDVVKTVVDTTLPKAATIRNSVRATVKEYFIKLEGAEAANVYELFLAEVELPLLELTLQYTHDNQSLSAKILSISRGTLRKKMHQYGLLKSKRKR